MYTAPKENLRGDCMGFFDEVFGDPEKQFKKDIERWKKEDEAWMNEIREDDRRWQRAGGDPELYDAMKSYEDTVKEAKKSFEAMERHRKQNFDGGGLLDTIGRIQNRAYSRAMDRDADRLVRELEREGRKYD